MTKKLSMLLASILLLASCSTRFGLVKRKYNKGYYFAVSKKQDAGKKEEKRSVVTKPSLAKINPGAEILNTEIVNTTVSQRENREMTVNHNNGPTRISSGNSTKNNNLLTASAIDKSVKENTFKNLPLLLQKSKTIRAIKHGSSASNDTNTILLVVLCLFWWLDLVAVYLHDGKKITMNFWITLLLNLLVLPGIIFAILVVLDVVNLA